MSTVTEERRKEIFDGFGELVCNNPCSRANLLKALFLLTPKENRFIHRRADDDDGIYGSLMWKGVIAADMSETDLTRAIMHWTRIQRVHERLPEKDQEKILSSEMGAYWTGVVTPKMKAAILATVDRDGHFIEPSKKTRGRPSRSPRH